MSSHAGTELRRLREAKGLTLEQAARDTCLRPGLLRELEDCAAADDLPQVYQKLSLRMYARYLGLDFEVSRRARQTAAGVRIAPVSKFVRRMGRLPQPARTEPGRRNRLLALAKTTSVAVVVVLAIGLWSLNAKISRLNLDEDPGTPKIGITAETADPGHAGRAMPTLPPLEWVQIDEAVVMNLVPPAAGGQAPAPQP